VGQVVHEQVDVEAAVFDAEPEIDVLLFRYGARVRRVIWRARRRQVELVEPAIVETRVERAVTSGNRNIEACPRIRGPFRLRERLSVLGGEEVKAPCAGILEGRGVLGLDVRRGCVE